MVAPMVCGGGHMQDIMLWCGDCLEYMRGMAAGSVDAVITDPPYGIHYASSWTTRPDGTPRCKAASFGADEFDPRWLGQIGRITKPDASLYCFTRWDMIAAWAEAIESAGFRIKQR